MTYNHACLCCSRESVSESATAPDFCPECDGQSFLTDRAADLAARGAALRAGILPGIFAARASDSPELAAQRSRIWAAVCRAADRRAAIQSVLPADVIWGGA
jgi:hypothetical protein